MIIMSIYIIFLIISLVLIIIFLIYYIIGINISIKEINNSLEIILNNDTNQLITISTTNKMINELVKNLNKNLKEIRKLEIIYKNGSKELQESITNISHDLRTPLTAIKGYIDLIKKEKSKTKITEYLKIIENKSGDLAFLTEQLYDYSKSLDLKDNIKKEKVCLNDVLEDTILSYYALIKKKNLTPEINITKKRIYRKIDKNMLTRILENIISNTIKYTNEDIKITLLDNGKIIFKNKTNLLDTISINKIFDRYYTIENGSNTSGIGLSIAKQLVKINNGKINAKYNQGYLIVEIDF